MEDTFPESDAPLDPSPSSDPGPREDWDAGPGTDAMGDQPPTRPLGSQPSRDERQWAMFAHLSALAGGLVSSWFGGLGVFIGPLVIWLLKREEMPFVDDQAKEALNFNITFAAIALALVVLGVITFGIGFILTLPLLVVAGVAWLVLTIVAAVRANEGKTYRYPFSLRLIK